MGEGGWEVRERGRVTGRKGTAEGHGQRLGGSARCTVTGGGHTCEQSISVYETLCCTPETDVILCVKYTAIKQLGDEQVKINN